jgi:hypothetical protein
MNNQKIVDVAEPLDRAKNWRVRTRVEKYFGKDANQIAGCEPDEVVEGEGNLLLNDGITALLTLLIGGATYPAFSNANARLKVGNGTVAAAAAQTDLQGTSTAEAPMDMTYPSIVGQMVTFQATFGSSAANFAWEEWGIKNGAGAISATVKLLNRKVAASGTKDAGSTWTFQVAITIS